MKHILLYGFLCIVFMSTFALAIPHMQYPSYAQPQSGFIIAENFVNVQDDLIYFRGYYSINGENWIPFTYQGSSYKGSSRWLAGSASANLPNFGEGEHYVLTYSCTSEEASWNCQGGRWQLHIIDNKQAIPPPLDVRIIGVRASESQDAAHGPEKALDGIATDTSFWAAEGDGQWLEFELSDVVTVSYVQFAFYANTVRYFHVETSLDGQSWTRTASANNASTQGLAHQYQRFSFAPRQAKYVRFVGHGSAYSGAEGWNAVSEADINGFAVDIEEQEEPEPQEECTPNNNECGSDGCGGSHGDCATGYCFQGSCVQGDTTTLFSQDFNHRPLGYYETEAEWKADWNDGWGSNGQNFRVVTDPVNPNNKVGMFTFPFYDSNNFTWQCWGDGCGDKENKRIYFNEPPTWTTYRSFNNGVGPGSAGGAWYPDLGGSYEEAYVTYRIRASPDFIPARSGKFFGFYPTYRPCGCENTDCEYSNGERCPEDEQPCDGIADEFVAKHSFNKHEMIYYTYFYGKANACGDVRTIQPAVTNLFDGEWHMITLYVRLNDPDVPNGVMRTWVDGAEKNSWTGVLFRTGDDHLGIERLGVTTFFGGDWQRRCERTSGWLSSCSQGAIHNYLKDEYDTCAADPTDPCSDVLRYSDGTPYYYYAPRKTQYLYVDDIEVYIQ